MNNLVSAALKEVCKEAREERGSRGSSRLGCVGCTVATERVGCGVPPLSRVMAKNGWRTNGQPDAFRHVFDAP